MHHGRKGVTVAGHDWKAAYTRVERTESGYRPLVRIGSWCEHCETLSREIWGADDQKIGETIHQLSVRTGVSKKVISWNIATHNLETYGKVDGEWIVEQAEVDRWLATR